MSSDQNAGKIQENFRKKLFFSQILGICGKLENIKIIHFRKIPVFGKLKFVFKLKNYNNLIKKNHFKK